MKSYKATFCDPFKKDIIDLGYVAEDEIMNLFYKTNWDDYLKRMSESAGAKIYYSPSLEIQRVDINLGLSISVIENDSGYEFYVFYKRPKTVKTFFGLGKRLMKDYITDKQGQTRADVIDYLNALMDGNAEYLEQRLNN